VKNEDAAAKDEAPAKSGSGTAVEASSKPAGKTGGKADPA
jgi:hypothetical protein